MINTLKGYRCRIGENQEEFAKNVEMAFSTYSRKERNGCSDFTAIEMANIKNYLIKYFPNITVDEIFFKNN